MSTYYYVCVVERGLKADANYTLAQSSVGRSLRSRGAPESRSEGGWREEIERTIGKECWAEHLSGREGDQVASLLLSSILSPISLIMPHLPPMWGRRALSSTARRRARSDPKF